MEILKSKIMLCKGIKLDKDYVNVLNYSESDMVTLCESKAVAMANDYSFIRNTGRINTEFDYATALQCDYIAFQNKDYSNKWFFAFLDEVVYKGENNTELIYTVDVWSTWFSYWTPKTCFVIREHVNNDTIGLHTIPENLDVGEVVQESETSDSSYTTQYGFYIAIQSAWRITDNSTGAITDLNKGKQYSGVTVYDNNVFGTEIFLFPITQLSDFYDVYKFTQRTASDGHAQDMENVFIVPNAVINQSNLTSHTAYLLDTSLPFTFYTLSYDQTPTTFNTTITKRNSFTGVTIKNNKCFVYPYNFMYVTNNNGSSNIYKYEDFSTTNCVFENQISLTIGCSGRIVPKNYKGATYNTDEALALGKYPTCAWSCDAFTNWLTQNAVNIPVNATMSMLGIGTGGYSEMQKAKAEGISTTGIKAGIGINVAGTVANTIGQFYSASLLPNITGGQATGDIVWGMNNNKFVFREMRVKNEYIKVIDDYFTRFGYKVNSLKVPNITGRTYWNYIEIASSEEIAEGNDLPASYMSMINSICQKGVTIWHSHANIGNYSLSNAIVS